jgi:NAD(P)-dependent dehydrogenase (short-subunit alcohol dehydrogenase family)
VLSDAKTAIEATRYLCWRACRAVDLQSPGAEELAIEAKVFGSETERALVLMSKQGRGHIVTITTSLVDQPMSSVQAALASLTKGALNAATKALAISMQGPESGVNAVEPEWIVARDAFARLKRIKHWQHSTQWVGWEMCPTS